MSGRLFKSSLLSSLTKSKIKKNLSWYLGIGRRQKKKKNWLLGFRLKTLILFIILHCRMQFFRREKFVLLSTNRIAVELDASYGHYKDITCAFHSWGKQWACDRYEANHLEKNLYVVRFWSIINWFWLEFKIFFKEFSEIKSSQDQRSNTNKETKRAYMINPRAKELHWITGFSKNEKFGKKEQRSRNRTLTVSSMSLV